MQERACFFIGHRDTGPEVAAVLADVVERHITEYGVRDFYAGHYGGFDRMAAQAVLRAQKRHPEVALTCLLPYYPAGRPLMPGFDATFYPPGMEDVPKRFAIPRANRWMIAHSGYLIACVWRPASNTQGLMEYALSRERRGLLHITNLAGQEDG